MKCLQYKRLLCTVSVYVQVISKKIKSKWCPIKNVTSHVREFMKILILKKP